MSDFNITFFEKLYSKMAASTVLDPRKELLIVNNPGQFISGNMGDESERNYALSRFFDQIPQFNFVGSYNGAHTISKAYKSVLDYKETPRLQPLETYRRQKLDNAEQSMLDRIDQYRSHKYEYETVMQELQMAEASQKNGGPPVSQRLKAQVKNAFDKWVATGKNMVELDLAIIASEAPYDIPRFWDKAISRFQNNEQKRAGTTSFYPTNFIPAYNDWFKNAGWSPFSFNQNDLDRQNQSNAIGVAGFLPSSFGLFAISGSFDFSIDMQSLKIGETMLDIRCELMRVNLQRNWMDENVLTSRAWRFDKSSPFAETILSTGGSIDDATVPSGAMTVLPETAILCRNVKITGNLRDIPLEEIKNTMFSKAVGFGPFSLSGKFLGKNDIAKGNISERSIDIPDVQLLGVICKVLPKCPNPDGALPWKS